MPVPALTAATFRAAGEAMTGKREDRTEGLAEQSLNTSVVHPGQGGRDHGDTTGQGNRSLTGNDQRKGLEALESDQPKTEDRRKP